MKRCLRSSCLPVALKGPEEDHCHTTGSGALCVDPGGRSGKGKQRAALHWGQLRELDASTDYYFELCGLEVRTWSGRRGALWVQQQTTVTGNNGAWTHPHTTETSQQPLKYLKPPRRGAVDPCGDQGGDVSGDGCVERDQPADAHREACVPR